ncbi:OPT oligopeptide transporter protein-domain-containing protein [Mycena metata]|uniref:OPT oligopeptide transporter protein-domain-containing protein n=1 Tax=Mycena metata TaxID=1033252 RepID=A0AAD7MQA3_9AGAR|nr:OPT oligopeptide transporter protein-domain-containing protein [Mycena metata]
MEDDYKPYTSSTEQLPPTLPSHALRRRALPDVPQDAVDHDYLMEHLNDPNLDFDNPRGESAVETVNLETLPRRNSTPNTDVESAPSTRSGNSGISTAIEFDDESPYPEVRMAVSKVDDPLMPVNTFRMWFLGLFFTVLLAGINQVFEYRAPSVFITAIVGQLVSLPAGKFLEWVLPTRQFKTLGYVWSFNPGPFNIKEHVCITAMINVAYNGAIATDVLATQHSFFGQRLPWIYQILLILGTQTFGFSLGGMLRQFVVWPSSMIWPSTLVSSALFNTLHTTYGKRDRGHMTRQRFFFLACVASFVWYWFPGYLFTALSFFNWICWLAPTNVTVNALFGASSGLGMSIVSFDWAMISFIGSPLATPWWSTANVIASVIFCFWIITPIIYFKNIFFTAFLPLSSFLVFDNTGAPYNTSATVVDGAFDVAAYEAYSPVFLTSAMAMGYFVAFASFASIFTHTFLWFGRDIIRRFRSTLKTERDVHSRLMQVYPEVPSRWYAIVGAVSTILILIAVNLFPTGLPIWAALLALVVAVAVALPLAIIQAITNQAIGLNVMEELLAGYIVPGRPVANMIFKAICLAGSQQAITFASDLKLGHYMKIPPRTMFTIQVSAVVVTCFVVTSVNSWMLDNVPGICTADAPDNFVCPSTNVFADAALIWGGIGPQRLFGRDGLYNQLLWGFPVGLIAPIPFYVLARRFPRSNWRYVNIPVFCGGVAAIPAASAYNYAAWGLTGFIFNYHIRRAHFRWWMRYNYILSAALDAGLALALVVMFFVLVFPTNGFTLNWVGNTIWQNTADIMGLPLLTSPTGTFGPTQW